MFKVVLITNINSKTTKFTLEITRTTIKTVSVLEVPSCGLMIVQTNIHLHAVALHIQAYGTMGKKYGATSKEGTCTLLQT